MPREKCVWTPIQIRTLRYIAAREQRRRRRNTDDTSNNNNNNSNSYNNDTLFERCYSDLPARLRIIQFDAYRMRVTLYHSAHNMMSSSASMSRKTHDQRATYRVCETVSAKETCRSSSSSWRACNGFRLRDARRADHTYPRAARACDVKMWRRFGQLESQQTRDILSADSSAGLGH